MSSKLKLTSIQQKLVATCLIVTVLVIVFFAINFYLKYQQTAGLSINQLLKIDKEKIIDYQVINSGAGDVIQYRYVSDKEVPAATYQGLKEDLSKRTDNSQSFLKSVKPISDKLQQEEYIAKFYSGLTFQKDGDTWYQVETATTTPTAFASQTKLTLLDQVKEFLGQKVLADTLTPYSGAGDGYVERGDFYTWSATHDDPNGSFADSTTITAEIIAAVFFDPISPDTISRTFLPFDTSAIPSNATINSATLSVYAAGKVNESNDPQSYLGVVQTTQPDSTTLTVADYDLAGAVSNPTQGATAINIVSIATSAYNTFTLNATGLTWVAKSGVTSSCGTTTGVTCLGLRTGHDIENNTIEDNARNSVTIYTSNETGTSKDPYLLVTYAVPVVIKIDGGTIKIDGGTVKINN